MNYFETYNTLPKAIKRIKELERDKAELAGTVQIGSVHRTVKGYHVRYDKSGNDVAICNCTGCEK